MVPGTEHRLYTVGYLVILDFSTDFARDCKFAGFRVSALPGKLTVKG